MGEVEREALWRADDRDNFSEELVKIEDQEVTYSTGLKESLSGLKVCGSPFDP